MSWLAHFVAGPLHGAVEFKHAFWPIVPMASGRDVIYRLVGWVEESGKIKPETPLLYVWGDLTEEHAVAAVDAYIALHSAPSGVLAGYSLTRTETSTRTDAGMAADCLATDEPGGEFQSMEPSDS